MRNISDQDRANVLVQALPYIQKWAGKTIVVKYGGNAMISPELKDAVMSDIVLLQLIGRHAVLGIQTCQTVELMLDRFTRNRFTIDKCSFNH